MGGFAPLALAQAPGSSTGAPPAASGGPKAAIDRPLQPATAEQRPPAQIGLQADEQGFDGLLDRFVARGDVQIDLAGGRLLADRLEYETKTRTLYIAGRVRFWRGEQYFQANSLRYSLAENRGDAEAVYGVIDLDTTTTDFDLEQPPTVPAPPLSYWGNPAWGNASKLLGFWPRQTDLRLRNIQAPRGDAPVQQVWNSPQALGTQPRRYRLGRQIWDWQMGKDVLSAKWPGSEVFQTSLKPQNSARSGLGFVPPTTVQRDAQGLITGWSEHLQSAQRAQQALAIQPLAANNTKLRVGLTLDQQQRAALAGWGARWRRGTNPWLVPPVFIAPAARSMACPPLIPAVPNWHPYPTAITAWGYGQAIDANFGDAFFFNGRMRPEYLWGFNVNRRLIDAGPLALEFDSNALLHTTGWQQGGPYNNTSPNAALPPQTFGEFTGGLGLRAWLQPWLSLGFVQGVSFLTENSLYEQTFRGSYQTFLNYLAFEVEALVKPQWSVVGRLHHRSGAYGTYGGVSEGSNAYLVGVRYRFGEAPPPKLAPDMPAPQSCPGAPPPGQSQPKPLSEQLNQVAQGEQGQALRKVKPIEIHPQEPSGNAAAEERQRHLAIAAVEQRVSNIQYVRSLKLERRQGGFQYDQTAEERQFGQAQPQQLLGFYGEQKLVDGIVSRWRFQTERMNLTPEGWQADRAAFTNDPFTPSQSWLDLEAVTAQSIGEGKTKIKAKRSRLILENRLPIPMRRNLTLEKKKPVDNRFVVADDGIDRSGIYFGYRLPEYDIPNTKAKLKLEPQFMVARALNGSVSTYPLPGSPAGAPNGTQTAQIGDLFGAMAKVEGKIFGFATSDFAVSLSTLNPSNFANGTRSWGDFSRSFQLPYLGILPAGTYTTRLYGAYRYRSFNGSLGYQDVYSAVGASLENTGQMNPLGPISNNYFWRASFGNYQGTTFSSNSPTGTSISQTIGDSTRASFYGAINSSLPIWTGKPRNGDDPKSTQNTPTPIIPGLTLNTVTSTALDYYGNGSNQNLINFSGGPTLTLGSFTKNFFDYTQLTITGGGTLQQGASLFAFDRNVDLATLGIGWTQQLFGPLLFNLGLGYNVDPSSPYFGYTTNAYGELRWQRRGYEFAIYYSPYEQVGGIRVKLNDFNFNGTGVPFVPTKPFSPTRNRQSLF